MELLRIKELLKEKDITGKDLAGKVGIHPVNFSKIINGNSFPKPDLLKRIAEELDVDIRELFYPTKGFGESPEINGFVEYKKETFKINNYEDLTQLMEKVNKEC
jgi:transcriptional regulator with XRE-family HTH domain